MVAHIVGEEIKSGQIVPIKTAKKNVINKIALVQLQDKIPSLTEKTFVNFLETDIISSGSSKKFLTVFQVE